MRRKRIAVGVLGALGIVVALAAAYVGYTILAADRAVTKSRIHDEKLLHELTPVDDGIKEPTYLLVMGVDSRSPDEASRADTIMLVRLDPAKRTISLLSIPRDLRVEVPGHGKTKINHSHTYGGPSLTVKTVKEFTGLPIHHYVEIDFAGFKELVDAVGGVTVDVPHEVDDLKAANYVRSAARIPAGVQTLDGAHALTFVRSRAYPRGDFQRIENQQAFLKALARKLSEPSTLIRLNSLVRLAAEHIGTDMTMGRILKIADVVRNADLGALQTYVVPGTPRMIGGVSYVILDDEKWASVKAMFNGEAAPGTQEATATPDPASVKVAVRNGAGVAGVAADAARRLTREGYRVVEVGNMGSFVYDETLVVYKEDSRLADNVVAVLGLGRTVRSRGMYRFDGDVLVVVGRDWGVPKPRDSHNLIR